MIFPYLKQKMDGNTMESRFALTGKFSPETKVLFDSTKDTPNNANKIPAPQNLKNTKSKTDR